MGGSVGSVELTLERLKEVLRYEPDTGYFYWIIDRPTIKAGDKAGTINGDGYRVYSIDGVRHQGSRLAWLYVNGHYPPELMDHINRNRSDDRICNLREASRAQNTRNSKLRRDNQSGHKGIYWEPKKKLWRVMVTVSGKRKGFGRFKKFEDAKLKVKSLWKQIDSEFYECP